MRYLLIPSLLLLAGCSTLPEADPVSFDTSAVLATQEPLHQYTVPTPADLPAYPKVKVIEGTNKVYACFEEEGFREIVRLRGYHDTNVQTIKDLQHVINARTEVANYYLEAGQASEKEANGLKELRSVEQSDCAREKRELTKTLWRDRIVGGAVIFLLILAL